MCPMLFFYSQDKHEILPKIDRMKAKKHTLQSQDKCYVFLLFDGNVNWLQIIRNRTVECVDSAKRKCSYKWNEYIRAHFSICVFVAFNFSCETYVYALNVHHQRYRYINGKCEFLLIVRAERDRWIYYRCWREEDGQTTHTTHVYLA